MSETSSGLKTKWTILAGTLTFSLFVAILAFDYADQALMSPLLNTLLGDFFHNINNVVPLGYVSFIFTILSALSMVCFGFLADKVSRKRICFIGCMIYGSFSILTSFTPHGIIGYVFYFITRAINGIGIGAIVPSIYTLTNDSIPAQKRATAFGILGVGSLLGKMIGLASGGSVAGLDSNWRLVYLIIGLINLMLGVALLSIREPKRGIQDQELHERLISGANYNFKFSKADFKILLRNKSNTWLILNFIDTIPGSMLLFLIFKYFEDIHNMQAGIVNLIIALVALFGGIGTVLFGKLGDIWFQKDRRGKVFIALFCNAFPMIFLVGMLLTEFWVPDNLSLGEILQIPGVFLVILMISMGMFINQGVGPNWMSSVVEVNLPEHRATMIALANFADLLGNALGPLIGSYICTYFSIQTAMWSMLIFWALNVLVWIPVLTNIRADIAKMHTLLEERAKMI